MQSFQEGKTGMRISKGRKCNTDALNTRTEQNTSTRFGSSQPSSGREGAQVSVLKPKEERGSPLRRSTQVLRTGDA